MMLDLLPLIISAAAGGLAAIIAWRERKMRNIQQEFTLKWHQQSLRLPDPNKLDARSVEERLDVLSEISPDVALVEAWRTLEAVANRKPYRKNRKEFVYGRKVIEFLASHGLVGAADVPRLESLLQARNAALHVVEERTAPVSATLDVYRQLVLQIVSKAEKERRLASGA